MKLLTTGLLFFSLLYNVLGQDKVLVFTKTNGFSHASKNTGATMISDLGIANGLWATDQTEDANDFTAGNLEQYKAVIWCNTSGNGLLNTSQQEAFEGFINAGGGFLGIHAATDTYRDKSWAFYNDLVGGIVQSNPSPNHTSNNYNANMTIVNPHESVDFLGEIWNKSEEYYYWKNDGGQLYDGNINLLMVEPTGNNDYDEARPISWYKEFQGGRSFYTALGHNSSDYTDNEDFIKHIEEGLKYVIGNTDAVLSTVKSEEISFGIYPNPIKDVFKLQTKKTSILKKVTIYNINGQLLHTEEILPTTTSTNVNIEKLSKGIYLGRLIAGTLETNFTIIKE